MAASNKHLKRIAVGSTNQLKIKAVADCFDNHEYNVVGLHAFESTVSEYPVGKNETYAGALYRAKTAYKQYGDASFAIGIESGFLNENGETIDLSTADSIYVIVCIVVLNKCPNADKELEVKMAEICLWSETLKCPITAEQRRTQISSPIKKYLSNAKI